MKIAYVASSIIPSQAANSIHVMKMCQALAQNGYDVTLWLPDKNDINVRADDIYAFYGVKKNFQMKKIKLPNFYGNSLVFAFLSILKARKEKPDLIYTRFLFSCFFSLLFNLTTIFEVHASFTTLTDKLFFHLMSKGKVKRFVAISHSLRNFFADKYRISKDKILVAPDGADPIDNSVKPKEIKKNSDQITIGYVGHLYKGRGVEMIAELAKRCPWAVFHMIGGIPEDVAFWKNELAGLKNIIFHGHVPPREVYSYMLAFDALIAPYQETVCVYGGGGNTVKWMSPLKIFEYMAAGKPILASDLPVLREILMHKKNCLLALPKDVDKWMSNLELIKNDIKLRESLGQSAQEDFKKNYTWRSRAKNIIND
jgi:glycosyltransferase involved in cell wall biosynthesis